MEKPPRKKHTELSRILLALVQMEKTIITPPRLRIAIPIGARNRIDKRFD